MKHTVTGDHQSLHFCSLQNYFLSSRGYSSKHEIVSRGIFHSSTTSQKCQTESSIGNAHTQQKDSVLPRQNSVIALCYYTLKYPSSSTHFLIKSMTPICLQWEFNMQRSFKDVSTNPMVQYSYMSKRKWMFFLRKLKAGGFYSHVWSFSHCNLAWKTSRST